MASLTQWTWVWVNSGSWWWAGKPGVLQSMGSQRVGHNWVTELNWSDPHPYWENIHSQLDSHTTFTKISRSLKTPIPAYFSTPLFFFSCLLSFYWGLLSGPRLFQILSSGCSLCLDLFFPRSLYEWCNLMPQATIDFLRLFSTLLSKVASLDTLFHILLLIYFDNTAHPAILLLICSVLLSYFFY